MAICLIHVTPCYNAAMASDSCEPVRQRATRSLHWPLSWPLLLVGGWAIYELTTQPALGIVMICLKFGWSDFQTAFWLRRVDPIRTRGRAFFWMHLGSGFWKTALTALAPMFATPFIMDALGRGQAFQGQAGPPAHFMGACLTAIFGFLLSAFLTALAAGCAWRHRVPLWLNPAIHQDRREKNWPPFHALTGKQNNLGRLLVTMLTAFVFSTFSTALIWMAIALEGAAPRAGNKGNAPALFGVVLTGALIAAAVTILGGKECLLRRIGAKAPSDSWPDAYLTREEIDAALADS
jgi:hypothetical protein